MAGMLHSRPHTSVHRSLTRSSSWGMPKTIDVKFSFRLFCQPGSSDAAHAGSVGLLLRSSTVDGVRWNT